MDILNQCNNCICIACDCYYSCTGDCQKTKIREHKECNGKKSCEIKDKAEKGEVIKFRKIVNDAQVWPWELMPEVQPPTIQALKEYMNRCSGWDSRLLQPERTLGENGHYVKYGLRKQLYIPIAYSKDDFDFIGIPEQYTLKKCPFCGGEAKIIETTDNNPVACAVDEGYKIICTKCGFSTEHNGIVQRIAADAINLWNTRHE